MQAGFERLESKSISLKAIISLWIGLLIKDLKENSHRPGETFLKIHLTPVLGNPREWGSILKTNLSSLL